MCITPLKKVRPNGGQQSTEHIANEDNENGRPNTSTGTAYLENTDHTNVDSVANVFYDIEKSVPQDILLAKILDKTSSDPLYGLQKQTI